MTKNKLFIVVLTICIISMLMGFLTPFINKSDNNAKPNNTKQKTNLSKLMNPNKVAVIGLNGVINSTPENNIFIEENSSLVALKALN